MIRVNITFGSMKVGVHNWRDCQTDLVYQIIHRLGQQ